MANDDLPKLDQLTIEEEKMDKDDDSTDISKENYLNNKSLWDVLGKKWCSSHTFLQKWPSDESQKWREGCYNHAITLSLSENYTPKATIHSVL